MFGTHSQGVRTIIYVMDLDFVLDINILSRALELKTIKHSFPYIYFGLLADEFVSYE